MLPAVLCCAGADTIYGAPFRDEFHSRLRFTHRGLIACANANEKNTNGSQFFITLDKCVCRQHGSSRVQQQ
jgi:cyclophilin family peptidyl-prolyl cis-trans isomerase